MIVLIQWDSWEVIENHGCNLWTDEFLRMNAIQYYNKLAQGLIDSFSSEILAEAGPSYLREITGLEWVNFESPSNSEILCSLVKFSNSGWFCMHQKLMRHIRAQNFFCFHDHRICCPSLHFSHLLHSSWLKWSWKKVSVYWMPYWEMLISLGSFLNRKNWLLLCQNHPERFTQHVLMLAFPFPHVRHYSVFIFGHIPGYIRRDSEF